MNNRKTNSSKEDYKFLFRYVKGFLATKKIIFRILIVSLILGILTIIFTPKTYSSRVTFISQSSGDSNRDGGLKSFVSLLSGGSKATTTQADLPLYLYPKLVKSLNFQRKLYDTPIEVKGLDTTMTYKEYFLNVESKNLKAKILKYTIGLPKLIFGDNNKINTTLKIDSLEYVNTTEKKLINSLNEKVTFVIDELDGTLEIVVSVDNQPVAAAQMAQSAHKLLQDEVIRFRIAKAKEKFDFIEKQYEQKKILFQEAQRRLASYSDRNLYNNTQSSLIRKKQLEEESTLLYSIYSNLEQQLLTQSIKIQEDTPAFTVINPAVVPSKTDNKSKIMVLLIFVALGFVFSIFRYVYVLIKRYTKDVWNQI